MSAGWLAGCLVQATFVISLALHGRSRLKPDRLTPPGQSLAFYDHVVLLPSLGWNTSWWLRSFAGANGATAIVAVILAVSFGLILVIQPGARLFVVTAVAVGFIFTVVSISINPAPAINAMLPTQVLGTRYTIMADFLIVSALIVGADHALRRDADHDRVRWGCGRTAEAWHETVFEPRVGGGIVDRAADGSECRWARILAFDSPARVVFSWDNSRRGGHR